MQINFTCNLQSAAGAAADFDDVAMDTSPLRRDDDLPFGQRSSNGIAVHWRTGTEVDLLGFQVYRSRGPSWRPITHSLVAAKGSVSGDLVPLPPTGRRSATLRTATASRLSNRDGTTAWFGPVRVT